MKICIAIVLSAVAAAMVMVGVLSLSSGSPSAFLSVLPAALLIAVPYVAIIGGAFYALLRKKRISYFAYAAAGGVAGACYLLVPMILSGDIGDLTKDLMSFVPFGLTLIFSGSIAGMVFRFCVVTYEKKIKAA